MSEPLFLPEMTGVSSMLAYLGMLSILAAFVLETQGRLSSRGDVYLGLMAFGSGLLAVRAAHMREWAFLVLEVVWFVAAAWAMASPDDMDAASAPAQKRPTTTAGSSMFISMCGSTWSGCGGAGEKKTPAKPIRNSGTRKIWNVG